MILLISGPSGAGKSTVYHELMRREPRLGFSVSTTTRAPRPGERDGVDYHFVDHATFARMEAAGEFLEWADVHGDKKATSRAAVEAMEAAGRIPLLDIDVQGGIQLLEACGPAVVSVFIWPPSWEALESRLRGRGTEAADSLETRLANARWEVRHAERYTYWVINDEVPLAVARLQAILAAEECRRERMGRPPLD
jgi:guanylate kinase